VRGLSVRDVEATLADALGPARNVLARVSKGSQEEMEAAF
jgi:hypothetical protein